MKDKDIKKVETVVGVVKSDRMDKTITVSVERFFRHPKFGKFIRRYTICKAHDPKDEAKIGDRVEIVHSRPISKTKNWKLVKILERKGTE